MRNFRLRKPPCQQYVSSSSLEIIHYAVIVAHPGDDVAVDVHGHRYARVTLKLLHTLWMLTFHEPNRSTCMSEIVKPYLGQPGTLESRFETAVHEVTGVRWRARRRGENVLGVHYPYLPSSIAPECLYSLPRVFYAATFTVLGFLFNSLDAGLRHRASYLQRVSLKIGPL